MRYFYLAMAAFLSLSSASSAEPKLRLTDVTIGQNLEVFTQVRIEGPAPDKEWSLTIQSDAPDKLLLSRTPDGPGAPSIVLPMRPKWVASPEFYLQGYGKNTVVGYKASAPGFETGTAKANLEPSGVVFVRAAVGILGFRTTRGAEPFPLKLETGLLDKDLNFMAPQPVAGGHPVRVVLKSSDDRVGEVHNATLTIPGGESYAEAEFEPRGVGATNIKLELPPGFSTPPKLGVMPITVAVPGLAVTTEYVIGQNLQIAGTVALGERAPAEGLVVTLTTKDPKRMLLSKSRTEVGSECIQLTLPPHAVRGSYYIQALGNSGEVAYEATAPGYVSRTGAITLSPSGMVMGGPQGPPDEAELFRKEEADSLHGFVTTKSAAPTGITVFAVQLDPVTGRGADLTVQTMRPGISAALKFTSSKPDVGQIEPSEVVIQPGTDRAETKFVPSGVGSTDISLTTPEGFAKAKNATSLRVIVKE